MKFVTNNFSSPKIVYNYLNTLKTMLASNIGLRLSSIKYQIDIDDNFMAEIVFDESLGNLNFTFKTSHSCFQS